jgi:site-specific DNA-methyltransferase (adenine-specific)
MGKIDLLLGDCLERMRELPDACVDAIVTDPPYGLSFMGKKWDYDVPSVEIWAECLRVLKPGGYLLAFAGTRTQHRMAVRIEDAGFEIRDMIAWVYGSGFPKSLDVSKAIDKAAGAEGTFGAPKSAAHAGWIERGRMRGEEGHEGYQRPWMSDANAVDKNARQYIGATEAAQQWDGWGTALKPALEPITVARKPLIGTVAANVLAHGTGAINVDGCRVEHITVEDGNLALNPHLRTHINGGNGGNIIAHEDKRRVITPHASGRWPANLIHDGSQEVLDLFPQTKSGALNQASVKADNRVYGQHDGYANPKQYGADTGSAARFFYCAKTSKKDREEGNAHPTVKPTDLMRYLCRLVTQPGGTVLDPFMGSGSTGKAAKREGFSFIGIERDEAYFEIAKKRINNGKD